MANETRDVKHYKIFELVRIKYTPREYEDRPVSPLIEQIPVAVFDDKDLLDAYVQAAGWRLNSDPSVVPPVNPTENETAYFFREEWREQVPTTENQTLPFNPVFKPIKQKKAPQPTSDASIEQPAHVEASEEVTPEAAA